MKRIQALISKEFLQLSRDPRLVGFIVIMPLVLLVLFGVALKLEPENVAMAVLDEDRSFFSDLIKTNVWSEGYFRLYDVPDRATLLRDIREGRARAGLHIGKDFSAQLTENNQPVVTLLVDGTMPSLATAMDNQSGAIIDERVTSNMYFLDADADNVIIAPDPFRLEVETLFNPDKNEAWFFLPGIIGVLIMQIALILTSTAIVREREEGTLEQLIVSPIRRWEFIAGKTLPYVAIAFVDFYAVLAVGWLGFGLPAPVSHSLLLLLGILYVFGLIALGLAISSISQTPQQAILLAIFILVPSVLLSGFIFPIEAMPAWVRPVAWVLPLTYFVEIIRGLLLKGNGFDVLARDFAALLGFFVVFTTLSVLRFRKSLD